MPPPLYPLQWLSGETLSACAGDPAAVPGLAIPVALGDLGLIRTPGGRRDETRCVDRITRD